MGQALEHARRALLRRSETPGLDSLVLLADRLNKPKEWVLGHPEYELSPDELSLYCSALDQVVKGVPLAYVLGWWEFYGRRFKISPSTLIPRPETELLVETAVRRLQAQRFPAFILDVGTGCGCIGITLLLESENAFVYASDISFDALQIARVNGVRFGVESRLQLIQSDLLCSFNHRFDLVCGNLPYVPSSELAHLEVAKWEPQQALDGGQAGIDWTLRAIRQLPGILKPGGVGIFEIGAGQAGPLRSILQTECQDAVISIQPDLSGIQRLLILETGN